MSQACCLLSASYPAFVDISILQVTHVSTRKRNNNVFPRSQFPLSGSSDMISRQDREGESSLLPVDDGRTENFVDVTREKGTTDQGNGPILRRSFPGLVPAPCNFPPLTSKSIVADIRDFSLRVLSFATNCGYYRRPFAAIIIIISAINYYRSPHGAIVIRLSSLLSLLTSCHYFPTIVVIIIDVAAVSSLSLSFYRCSCYYRYRYYY